MTPVLLCGVVALSSPCFSFGRLRPKTRVSAFTSGGPCSTGLVGGNWLREKSERCSSALATGAPAAIISMLNTNSSAG